MENVFHFGIYDIVERNDLLIQARSVLRLYSLVVDRIYVSMEDWGNESDRRKPKHYEKNSPCSNIYHKPGIEKYAPQ